MESEAEDGGGEGRSRRMCGRFRANHLVWIWYCVVAMLLQCYIVVAGVSRFLTLAGINWPGPQPYIELNAFVGEYIDQEIM